MLVPLSSGEATGARVGVGFAPAHHGEILQGVFRTDRRLMRGLVSLPCPLFASEVHAVLTDSTRAITIAPTWKIKARAAARLTLDRLGLMDVGAQIVVDSAIPVCRGFGSSTSDVVAAIRAAVAAAGVAISDAETAKLAVRAEVASDASMFSGPVLFAQRAGVVLERFGVALPDIAVLGFSTSVGGSGVTTLALPAARYSPVDIERFEELRGRLREALVRGDLASIGVVGTESARLNQRYLPVPQFDTLEAIVRDAGGVGLQVAHSGDIAGFLFDANDNCLEARLGEAREGLSRIGVATTWWYRLPDERSVQTTSHNQCPKREHAPVELYRRAGLTGA